MSRDAPQPLKLGAFEVDLDAAELRRDGERVLLQEKPFQLLVALLDQPGTLVTRETLRDRLWPNVFVDFDGNLNAAVKKLRDALGDSATQPRFIETVPRKGYRLITPVAETNPRRFTPRSPFALAAGLAAVLATSVAIAGWLRPVETLPGQRVMLAVLPFANLSGDATQDYLSDGMTEELLTALGRLQPERLGVIARQTAMAYKNSDKSVSTIGGELGVDYVLEGSIRGSGIRGSSARGSSARGSSARGNERGTTRVTAQLIVVADQTHLWAETYDSDAIDLLDVQAEIAHRIARSLALELLDAPPKLRGATDNAKAYDHYLRGRHQWHRFTGEGYDHAIAELERATELEPTYAAAWAALADAYNLEAFEDDTPTTLRFGRAREAAERALALAPNLAEAHNALAFALLYGDFDAAAADPIFRRARELDPNYAMSYHWHAGALAALDRHDEAIAAIRHSVVLDPLSLSVMSDLGWYYLFADRWQDAVRECRATLALSPDYNWAMRCLIEGEAQSGNREESIRLTLDFMSRRNLMPPPGSAFDGLSNNSRFETVTRYQLALEMAASDEEADFLWRAMLHSRLDEIEPAVAWLERAFEARDPWLVFLRVDPRFDALHGHPRFEHLASRLRIR